MNLPNKLTVLRIIMVPFFVFFMLTDVGGAANKWIALAIFAVASLTDLLDGKIARKISCRNCNHHYCKRVYYKRIPSRGI